MANKRTVKMPQDEESLNSLREQHRQLDALRRPKLTDLQKVTKEIDTLIQFREAVPDATSEELKDAAEEMCPYVKSSFPGLYKTAVEYEYARLPEFKELISELVNNLKLVQDEKLSQANCTTSFLEDSLVKRFYRKK
jgi:hypothetical protein